MGPVDWPRIKAVFDAAILVEKNEQSSYLTNVCACDEELRREVESLLASSDAAGSFMETPLAGEMVERMAEGLPSGLEPGQVLGRYTIIRKIGRGGMGDVFLAQDSELDRQVALKILRKDANTDKDTSRRFIREAKAASALNHPNILTVHDIGSFEESHFIATELIKGETLRARLNRERLRLSEILDITIQVAAALNAAHHEGIIHRDIKPENIMLRDDGLAKVLDFGLAKLTEPAASAEVLNESKYATYVNTSPGVVMGTVNYMSPEQVRGKDTDARTDIWSLAVVLYEMLTLRKPFFDETATDTIAAILTREPAPLGENVPFELQRIVNKALQKKLNLRYRSVKDFLTDVKDLKREIEFSDDLERLQAPPLQKSTIAEVAVSEQNATRSNATAISAPTSRAQQESRTNHLVRAVAKRRFATALGILLAALVGMGVFYGYSATGSDSINSVAVLPFVNTGGDPEQEYLSDGVSEALINALSRLPQLKVIARSSSFHYKGKEIDPREVAKELGVEVIVNGSVTRRGDNIVITVEMMNVADRTRIWGETYTRAATDAMSLQDEIALTVAENLRPRLTPGDHQQIVKPETSSAQAYDLRLKGWFLMRKGGQANLNQAIELFERAIVIDPNYARAYAGLSIAFSNIYGLGFGDPKEFRPKQEAAVRKAVELDPSLEDAHNALGIYFTSTFQWIEAEREYKLAIEINPNFAGAHANYAQLLSGMKRHEQAIAETRRAIEIDPLRAEVYAVLPEVLVYARRYDEAIDAAGRAIEMFSREPTGYLRLAAAHSHSNMHSEAIATYRRAVELDEKSLTIQAALGAAHARAGERGKADEILRKVLSAKEYFSKADLARLYIALGEHDKAFEALETAYTDRDYSLEFLAVDPAFDPIRTDPRFVELVARIGLPQ